MGNKNAADVVAEINGWTDVRGELEKRGVTGERDDCTACPLAVHIANETGRWVYVDSAAVHVSDNKDMMGGEAFDLSDAAQRFIVNFDGGQFPELDEFPVDEDEDEDYYPVCECCG